MKYFTKEYIKECDCEEIQNIKNNLERDGKYSLQFNEGDWWQNRDNKKINVAYQMIWENRQFYIWLPTGDQLDEEIVKILREKYNTFGTGKGVEYISSIRQTRNSEIWECHIFELTREVERFQQIDVNPLICKIKLLKELIKNEKS